MKKTLAILAALTFAVTAFAGCGEKDDSSSEKSDKKASTSSVAEETKEETSAEDESKADEESTADESVADESAAETSTADESTASIADSTAGDEMSEMFNVIASPSDETVDAAANDFVGKWECYALDAEGTCFDAVMGMPLYAVIHIEFYEDNTGALINIDDPTAASEEKTPIKWTYEDNKIVVESDDGEKVDCFITTDGYILFDDDTNSEKLYLRKVDEYTEFDFSTLENMFEDTSAEDSVESIPE